MSDLKMSLKEAQEIIATLESRGHNDLPSLRAARTIVDLGKVLRDIHVMGENVTEAYDYDRSPYDGGFLDAVDQAEEWLTDALGVPESD